ncbi:MAG: Hsp20/alpha crystallin family protein [Gemmatimonadota bacterium]
MRPLMPLRRSRRSLASPGFDGFENEVRRLLDEAFGEVESIGWNPAVEVTETADELELTAELPGMTRDDVEVELEDDVLTVSGTKKEVKQETEEDGEVTRRVAERSYGRFSRSFTVPSTVDADGISAEFSDGVLTVRMPKTSEAQGRKIEIEG